MKKTRKRLFAFSGLFVLVAQVLVMALCSIPAIAVTREETNRTLFNNEHGSATISYEEMESGGLNWTINLQKAAHDTATRFMVAMTADGQAIMPENVQTVMQSTPEISFTAGNGEGLMLAGLQEGAAGSGAGSAVITYQTSGNYGQMAVVPKLVTVGDTVSDLLAGNPGVVYDIPVKEEPAATEEAVTGELLLNDGQTATTETTEADAVEATTDSQDAEITESTTESTATDEATEVTETTDSSDAVAEGEVVESGSEDSTEVTESSSEADANYAGTFSNVVPTASEYTSLQFVKNWKDVPEDASNEEKTVYLQLMRRPKGHKEEEYQPYLEGEYDKLVYPDTIKEWHNLPVGEDTAYEYTVMEVPSPYYIITEHDWENPTESTINSLTTVSKNSSTEWQKKNPSYFVSRNTDGNWVIWTADRIPLEDRQSFAQSIAKFTPDKTQPHDKFEALGNYTGSNVIWIEGSVNNVEGISTNVVYSEDGIDVTITFSSTSTWNQYMYGTNSTRSTSATNTYVKPTQITVTKNWDDDQNIYNTRNEDIRLGLQVYQYNSDSKVWEWVDVQDKYLDIPAGSTDESSGKTFTVPTKTSDGEGGYVDAKYRVIEKVKDSDGNFTGNRVYGYATPTPTNPQAGDYTVTNTLLKTALSFTKVDGQGKPLKGVTFKLTRDGRDGMEDKSWTSEPTTSDGAVNFSGLPVGHYTLTETGTAPGYDKLENSWGFTVTDTNGTVEGMNIVWDEGKNPFSDQNITNNGKIVNNLKPFDLTVNKVDDQENPHPLAGATFELTDKDGNKLPDAVLENDGSSFVFKNLEPGTYTLTETDAPDGYAILIDSITITINPDGTVSVKGIDESDYDYNNAVPDDEDPETINNNTISITVANKKLVPLPATGGPGTLLFFVMGILAIAVTGIYFVSRQKQEVA